MLHQIITNLLKQWSNQQPLSASREHAREVHGQPHEWAEYVVIPDATAAIYGIGRKD